MSVLILPPGLQKTRDLQEIPAARMQRVIDFAALAHVYSFGLHCSKCGKDVQASNDDHAPILTMKCGCREFWSTNPLVTKQ